MFLAPVCAQHVVDSSCRALGGVAVVARDAVLRPGAGFVPGRQRGRELWLAQSVLWPSKAIKRIGENMKKIKNMLARIMDKFNRLLCHEEPWSWLVSDMCHAKYEPKPVYKYVRNCWHILGQFSRLY